MEKAEQIRELFESLDSKQKEELLNNIANIYIESKKVASLS